METDAVDLLKGQESTKSHGHDVHAVPKFDELPAEPLGERCCAQLYFQCGVRK